MTRKIILLISILHFINCTGKSNFSELQGPYLGQKPPGMVPEVFAPGLICTEEKYELNSVFSPDGTEFYYEISTTTPEEKKEGKYFYIIMVSRQVNGIWTEPELASFSGEYITVDMSFSPDGNRLYFCSDRVDPWGRSGAVHIWYVDREGSGWSEWKIMAPPIYSEEGNSQLSLAANNSMYLRMGNDLFYSKFEDGKFIEPINLGKNINTEYAESKAYIAPDESYLLFHRYGMPESLYGGRAMFISFRKEDGSWSPAKPTGIDGSIPKVTPDGKYLFFSRGGEIYWMDAGIIGQLKPENIK